MTMFGSQWLANAGASYEIDQSIRFNAADSPYLTKTFGADGGDTWTFSLWIKRSEITSGGNWYFFSEAGGSGIGFVDGTDKLRFYNASSVVDSTQVFRDVNAWYHFVFSNNAGTVTITVNNTAVQIGSTTATLFNRNNAWHIGSYYDGGNNFEGYMAEMNWIDGTALAPTSFGETNDDGVWVPKKYTGSYGTNGFYITGEDSSDLGADYSGNGNDFTSSGLAADDQVSDSPTLNFPVISPIDYQTGSNVTISNGNLTFQNANSGSANDARATFAVSSGKWYWEVEADSLGQSGVGREFIGVVSPEWYLGTGSAGSNFSQDSTGYAYNTVGQKINNGSAASYGSSLSAGNIVGVALDLDNGKIWWSVNGTFQASGNPAAGTNEAYSGLSGTFAPAFAVDYGTGTSRLIANFGQTGGLTYTPPTGFSQIDSSTLPAPTIKDGSANFQTTLYTGNGTAIGSGGLAVSQSENSTFQPDFVWIKERNGAADHALYDAVRGTTKDLASNNTTSETTETEGVTTFGSAGFTVGNLAKVNTSSDTYVAWQWKANGSGSSNEDGTINTTATSANTTAGFSMSTYTGNGSASQTVGHGLGVTPSVVLVLPRSNGDHKLISNWASGVTAFTEKMKLNDTEAASSSGTTQIIGGSSTTFTLGTDPGVNGSSRTYVAYCWAEVDGYSKMGTYTGNGSTDGPFIYTGFKPAFFMVKREDSADNWAMYDATRDPYNVAENYLLADTTAAETTYSTAKIDFLSNGFKWRGAVNFGNNSSGTYVYMAFAEHPFGGDGVAPATAR